jgi:hypothetical protein
MVLPKTGKRIYVSLYRNLIISYVKYTEIKLHVSTLLLPNTFPTPGEGVILYHDKLTLDNVARDKSY